MRKKMSLNKTIMTIVLFAYITILLLLGGMEYALLRRHQNEMRQEKTLAADTELAEISESMDYVKKTLYDLYSNNADLETLSRTDDDAGQAYSLAYDFREHCAERMTVDTRWHACYLFYNNNRDSLYYVNTMKMPAEDGSRIYQVLLGSVDSVNEDEMKVWSGLSIEDHTYLVMGLKKRGTTVCGLINLTDASRMISEKLIGTGAGPVRFCLADGGTVLDAEGVQGYDESDILEYVRDSGGEFARTKSGYYLRGMRLDGSDVWGIAAFLLSGKDYYGFWQILLFLIIICSAGFAVWIYQFLKKNLVQSVDDLRLKMEAVRRNSHNRALTVDARFQELQEMSTTMDSMLAELEQQKMRTYEAYIEKQKAQLQFLQLQMKPHFYLNGLKAMNALILNGQTDKAGELIINLSRHFRYLLYQKDEVISLESELAFTRNYCEVMDQMTGRHVHLEAEIPPELEVARIPVLSIQTFAENSVKYAKLGDADARLEIRVSACMLRTEEGDYLDLTVEDNGSGYDEQILREIQEECSRRPQDDPAERLGPDTDEAVGSGGQAVPEWASGPAARSDGAGSGTSHIGIGNLIRRCRILYGDYVEFSFGNRGGACSEVIIPQFVAETEGTETGS